MTDLNLNIRLRAVAGGVVGAIRSVRQNLAVMEREDVGRHRKVMARIDGVVGGYRKIGGAIRNAATAGAGLAGVFIGAGLVGIIRTIAQFEKYEAVLTGLEGSQAKAKASMAWVTDFAATTPFEIDQVMEAFVRLRTYGIDPTDGTLRVLGDTASTMGKDIMAAVEMMSDAQSGEFERLKEFGIKARQDGNRVTFSWVENGKTIERSTAKSGAEITRTLLGIMGPKNAGAMVRQSKTLGGIWSGLMDYITQFQVLVGDAGLGDFLRDILGDALKGLQTDDGKKKAAALAKDISDALIDGVKAIREALSGIDVKEFIGGLVSIVTFLPKVITFFGGFSNLITELGSLGIAKIGLDLGILGVTLGGLAGIAAAPIVFFVAIATALALVAWMIYRNWKGVSGFLLGIAHTILEGWRGLVGWFLGMWAPVAASFKAGADAIWNVLPQWLRMILTGVGFVVKISTAGVMAGLRGQNPITAMTNSAAANLPRLAAPPQPAARTRPTPGRRGQSPTAAMTNRAAANLPRLAAPPPTAAPTRSGQAGMTAGPARIARPSLQPGRGGPPQRLNVAVTHHSDGRPATVAVTSPSPNVRIQPARGRPPAPRGPVSPR